MYKKNVKIFAKAVMLMVILYSSELTPAQAYTTVLQWGGSDIEACMQWLNAGGKTICMARTANKSGVQSCYWCNINGTTVTLFGAYMGDEMCEPGIPLCGSNVQPLPN